MWTRPVSLVACGALCLALAGPASAADRILVMDKVARLGSLSAYGGVLAWARSTGSAEFPRTGYMQLSRGKVRRLAIRPRKGNGVIDLGPRRSGGIAAVYERCRRYPPDQGSAGCRIYRYGVSSRRSSPVRGASTRREGARWPAIWKHRVAFLRDTSARPSGLFFTVFATPPLTRLTRFLGGPTDVMDVGASGMDLRGRVVAYASEVFTADEGAETAIIVRRFDRRGGGRSCVVARAADDPTDAAPPVYVSQPRLAGRYLYWKRDVTTGATTPEGDQIVKVAIHRRRLPTGRCRRKGREQRSPRLQFPDSVGWSYAATGGRLFYTLAGALYEMRPVVFSDR